VGIVQDEMIKAPIRKLVCAYFSFNSKSCLNCTCEKWVGAIRIKTRPDDSFKGNLDVIEKGRL